MDVDHARVTEKVLEAMGGGPGVYVPDLRSFVSFLVFENPSHCWASFDYFSYPIGGCITG